MLHALTLAAALLAAPDSPAAPETVVRDFYAAFAAGDLAAASTLWTGPDAPGFAETERTMRVRCHALHEVRVRPRAVSATTATVEAEALLSTWTRSGGSARLEPQAIVVELQSTGDGWRISSLQHADDRLAEAIIAARPEERAALIDPPDRIVTPRLPQVLCRRAVTLMNAGRLEDAAQLAGLAQTIAERNGDRAGIAAVLSVHSILLRYSGNAREGLRAAEEGYAIAAVTGDVEVMAASLLRIVRALDASSGIPESTLDLGPAGASPGLRSQSQPSMLSAILDLEEELVDRSLLAHAASQMSRVYDNGAEDRQALSYALLAARHAVEAENASAIVASHMNVAGFHRANGDPGSAVPYLESAIEHAEAAGITVSLPSLWEWLSECHRELGTGAFAAASNEGIRAAGAIGNAARGDAAVGLLSGRADWEIVQGNLSEAECYLHQAVRFMDRCVHPECITAVWRSFARLRLMQKRYEEAIDAARLATTAGIPDQWSLVILGMALQQTGRLAEAEAVLREGIGYIEMARGTVSSNQQRGMFLRQYAESYRVLLDVLLASGDERRAFEIADSMRARLLRDILQQSERSLVLTAAEREEERRINERIAQLNRVRLRSRGTIEPKLRTELTRARRHLSDFVARVENFHGESATWRAGAAKELPSIPDGVVVLEYAHLPSRTALFILTSDGKGGGKLRTVVLPAPNAVLSGDIARLREQISNRHLGWRVTAERLYRALVAPAEPELRATGTVVIIPDGPLWDLPFHVLGAGRSELVASHAVSYAMHADGLALDWPPRRDGPERAPATATLVAFANPTLAAGQEATLRSMFRDTSGLGALPDAETEAREIAKIYGAERSRVYIGTDAHEARFKSEAGEARVLHIGTHGVVDPADPMFSAVVLAPGPGAGEPKEDGIVEARELAALRTRADVAVLAACDTGRGRYRHGEGLLGLSWALLTTGCPNVVVSQWKAASRPTSLLMIEFHRRLAAGIAPAEALRQAQRMLKAQRAYSHPFYWAPFVVVVNGRAGE
ncbi:MAG TPA: CHAT domain-containing tetratricopeptide repeat protein [Thermoanaerobaculia bacterium]|nr:CHAT domain-containing tetratricopeptide repeat protein [Thermoanaerobaculia bacterium]